MVGAADLFVRTRDIGVILAKFGLCTNGLAIPFESRQAALRHGCLGGSMILILILILDDEASITAVVKALSYRGVQEWAKSG